MDAKVVFSDARGGLFAVWRAALVSAREEKEESAWGRGSCAPARLRALRASGPSSIRALSTALARDYKSVHTDVVLLADAGLIKRNKDGSISAPWDKVQAELRLAS